MKQLNFRNVVCVTLLCLASLNFIQARSDVMPRDLKAFSEVRPRYFCNYDGNIYFDLNGNIFRYINQPESWLCTTSYTYQWSSSYVSLSLSNIQVSCNGFNNIYLFDEQGRSFDYCQSSRASSYTFVSQNARWVGITRYGTVSFNLNVQFSNSPVGTVTTTAATTTTTVATTVATTQGPSSSSCGVQAIKPDESQLYKIVGGTVAIANSWPWQVALKDSRGFFCGGSLINNQWIVTAGHCQVSVSGLNIHLGDHDVEFDGSGETIISASRWITHPQYDDYNIVNDIALIKLSRPVTFSNKIQPVCLPGGRFTNIGTRGFVTGWGVMRADGSGPTARYLRQVGVPVNDPSACNYQGFPPATQICAGVQTTSGERDSCQGDSGGPFVQKDASTGQWYLAGVVSYGYLCGGRGAYTRVSAYESWIQQTIAAN